MNLPKNQEFPSSPTLPDHISSNVYPLLLIKALNKEDQDTDCGFELSAYLRRDAPQLDQGQTPERNKPNTSKSSLLEKHSTSNPPVVSLKKNEPDISRSFPTVHETTKAAKALQSSTTSILETFANLDGFVKEQLPGASTFDHHHPHKENQALEMGLPPCADFQSTDSKSNPKPLVLSQGKRQLNQVYSQTLLNPASSYCHVCGKKYDMPGQPKLYPCSKRNSADCTKVVCSKCFAKHSWDIPDTPEDLSKWVCPHCSNTCPKKARCHAYRRTNARRSKRAHTNTSQ